MWTDFTGTLVSSKALIYLTLCIAFTVISAKKSLSEPTSLDDIEVLAALMRASLPRESMERLRFC